MIRSIDIFAPVCATLGEINEHNTSCWVHLNPGPQNPDVTTNIRLQVLPDEKDNRLWDVMDTATYVLLTHLYT